jgi:hypothetical protein
MTNEISTEIPVVNAPQVNQEEKLLPQSQVNKLIADAKAKAAQTAYNKGLVEAQQNQQDVSHSQTVNPGVKPEDIKKFVADAFEENSNKMQQQAQQYQAQQAWQQTANEVAKKVDEAAKRIPDYAEVLATVGNFQEATGIIALANVVDNTGDVLYELAKNPSKAGGIVSALTAGTPTIAKAQIIALSKSIKANQEANGDKIPDEPPSQLRPTNIGIGKAPVTASDFAKQFKGRY